MKYPVPNIISTCKFQNVRFAYNTQARNEQQNRVSVAIQVVLLVCIFALISHRVNISTIGSSQSFRIEFEFSHRFSLLHFLLYFTMFTLVYILYENDVQQKALLELEWRCYKVAVKFDKTIGWKLTWSQRRAYTISINGHCLTALFEFKNPKMRKSFAKSVHIWWYTSATL